ncbi:hypothetical protein HDE_01516 [Halotydeus destructor]|nr:hypothetical protein HDE_01516 [Halotydeus destructor]
MMKLLLVAILVFTASCSASMATVRELTDSTDSGFLNALDIACEHATDLSYGYSDSPFERKVTKLLSANNPLTYIKYHYFVLELTDSMCPRHTKNLDNCAVRPESTPFNCSITVETVHPNVGFDPEVVSARCHLERDSAKPRK